MMYINDMVNVIEMRKFFGKGISSDGDIVNINESIGAVVAEITENEGLSVEDQNKMS